MKAVLAHAPPGWKDCHVSEEIDLAEVNCWQCPLFKEYFQENDDADQQHVKLQEQYQWLVQQRAVLQQQLEKLQQRNLIQPKQIDTD